jgi:DNA-binding response OmpR family regulator
MDIGLPGMSGCETAQCIRGNKSTMNIPILALTAHASSKEVVNAIDVGINYYELKPVDYKRLMSKISEILQNARR